MWPNHAGPTPSNASLACPWREHLPYLRLGSGWNNPALPGEHAEGQSWTALTCSSLWLDKRCSWGEETEGMRAAPGGVARQEGLIALWGLSAFGGAQSSVENHSLPLVLLWLGHSATLGRGQRGKLRRGTGLGSTGALHQSGSLGKALHPPEP